MEIVIENLLWLKPYLEMFRVSADRFLRIFENMHKLFIYSSHSMSHRPF